MQKKKKVTTSKSKTGAKATIKKVNVKKTAPQKQKTTKSAKVDTKAKISAKPLKASTPPTNLKPVSAQKSEASAVLKTKDVAIKTKIDPKNLSADALEQYKRWLKYQKQLAEEKTLEYKMSASYEMKAPLNHKVHGWGVVVQKRDNYIDVLFEAGIKTLITNYKDA